MSLLVTMLQFWGFVLISTKKFVQFVRITFYWSYCPLIEHEVIFLFYMIITAIHACAKLIFNYWVFNLPFSQIQYFYSENSALLVSLRLTLVSLKEPSVTAVVCDFCVSKLIFFQLLLGGLCRSWSRIASPTVLKAALLGERDIRHNVHISAHTRYLRLNDGKNIWPKFKNLHHKSASITAHFTEHVEVYAC